MVHFEAEYCFGDRTKNKNKIKTKKNLLLSGEDSPGAFGADVPVVLGTVVALSPGGARADVAAEKSAPVRVLHQFRVAKALSARRAAVAASEQVAVQALVIVTEWAVVCTRIGEASPANVAVKGSRRARETMSVRPRVENGNRSRHWGRQGGWRRIARVHWSGNGILLLHEGLGSAGKAGGTLIVGAKERFARSKGLAAQATPIGFPKGVREGVRVDTCGIPKQEAVDTLVIVAGRTGKG